MYNENIHDMEKINNGPSITLSKEMMNSEFLTNKIKTQDIIDSTGIVNSIKDEYKNKYEYLFDNFTIYRISEHDDSVEFIIIKKYKK